MKAACGDKKQIIGCLKREPGGKEGKWEVLQAQ